MCPWGTHIYGEVSLPFLLSTWPSVLEFCPENPLFWYGTGAKL